MMADHEARIASLLDAERQAPPPSAAVQARVLARVEGSIAAGATGGALGGAGLTKGAIATAGGGKLFVLVATAVVGIGAAGLGLRAGLDALAGDAVPEAASPRASPAPAAGSVRQPDAPPAPGGVPVASERAGGQPRSRVAATPLSSPHRRAAALPPAARRARLPAARGTRPRPPEGGAERATSPRAQRPRERDRDVSTRRSADRPPPVPGPDPSAAGRAPSGEPRAGGSPPAPAPSLPLDHAEGGLARELVLLRLARAALNRGDPGAALTYTARHRRRFPDGALAEEREALSITALARTGDAPGARRRARGFESRYPSSLMLPAVRAAVAERAPSPAGP